MNECKHRYTTREGFGERQCASCGATLPCTHSRVLSMPALFEIGGATRRSRLRQCANCGRIGAADDTGIVWMRGADEQGEIG